VAIERCLLLVPGQGLDQCGVVDIAHEPGTDLDNAKVLGICDQPPAGELRDMQSGICESHIRQLDQDGALILE
jgi:hypothetical protein